MNTAQLVEFFQTRRECSFADAVRMAEAVVIRRTLKAEKAKTAQMAIPFSELAPPEPRQAELQLT